MTREEVIRGLQKCAALHQGFICESCEYPVDDCAVDDAIALLKAQEPVAPELQSGGNYVCGNCGMYTVGYIHPLTGESVATWKYCGSCGKKVKWE